MPETTSLTSTFTRIVGEDVEQNTYEQNRKKDVWKGGPVVNCACNACNSGWMQEMDQAIKPATTALALGERGTVSKQGVLLLATWATKIALVLDCAQNPPLLTDDTRRAFREGQHPMDGSYIWVGAASPADRRVRVRTSGLSPLPGATAVEGYVATFGVLHLVLQVLYPPEGLHLRRGTGFTKFMHRIWPTPAALKWPPPESSWLVGEDEFENLASSFEAAPK